MPTVAIIFGIKIMFFFNDHGIPHFHADIDDCHAKIAIETLEIIEGSLPKSKQKRLMKWVVEHKSELLAAWHDVRNEKKPRSIT